MDFEKEEGYLAYGPVSTADSLCNPDYTRDWIKAWNGGENNDQFYSSRFKRILASAYKTNLIVVRNIYKDYKLHKRTPNWCNIMDYVMSVRMLGKEYRNSKK